MCLPPEGEETCSASDAERSSLVLISDELDSPTVIPSLSEEPVPVRHHVA